LKTADWEVFFARLEVLGEDEVVSIGSGRAGIFFPSVETGGKE
jgi:hypothetical protein